MRAHARRLQQLRSMVPEITVDQARAAQQEGALIVDVREPDEIAGGSPQGAARLVRGFLELEIEKVEADLDREILVLCAGGVRSLYAAHDLQQLGYSHVGSIAGGFAAWKQAKLPVDKPKTLSSGDRERYGRHLTMPEVGEPGQIKLLESRVLLVGAGGLGSPAALYLAAAGIGTLGIVDDDVVDRSNLQRQILHTDDRVGTPKVDSARRTLESLNPQVRVVGHPVRLDKDNVEEIFSSYDLVIDGTDNFPTRYLVNDACVKLGLPNVHGAIFRFDGQVTVFWPGREGWSGPCYRCLFPEPPPAELAPSCAEAGVLGVLPGVIGTLEAVEAIKVLLGVGEPLLGRLILYDALKQSFTELKIDRNPTCPSCGEGAEILEYPDYELLCATSLQ